MLKYGILITCLDRGARFFISSYIFKLDSFVFVHIRKLVFLSVYVMDFCCFIIGYGIAPHLEHFLEKKLSNPYRDIVYLYY